jgi:tetratricopeptide (TPR) repeat protein
MTVLERARGAWNERAWAHARDAFVAADAEQPLSLADRQCLATAAYLAGDDVTSLAAWGLAYQELVAADDREGAARCAFWQAFQLLSTGEGARSGGWLTRAQRLLDECGHETAVAGYVQSLGAVMLLQSGDSAGAQAGFAEAIRIGERFADRDVQTLGRLGQGQALVELGQVEAGFVLLDEVMVAVTANEVSPVLAGLAYCAVIGFCREQFDLRRAAEWTLALADWCGAQPELVAYRGHCQVHRSEVLQQRGDWPEAMREAEAARERLPRRFPGRHWAWPTTSRASCTGCGASSARPRRTTARPSGGVARRSPGSRCCAWLRAGRTPPARRSAGCWTRRPRRTCAAGCCRPRSRSAWPGRTSRPRGPPPTSWP